MSDHIEEADVQQYSGRSLATERRREVEEHLMGCGQCQRTLRSAMPELRLPEEELEMGEILHPGYEGLSAYMDGGLSAEQRERIDDHMRICHNCSAGLIAFQQLEERLFAVPAKETAVEASKVPLAARMRVFFSPLRIQRLGLGFAMVVLGFFVMFHQNSPHSKKGSDSGVTAQTKPIGEGDTPAHPVAGLGGLLLLLAGGGVLLYGIRGMKK